MNKNIPYEVTFQQNAIRIDNKATKVPTPLR